MAYRAIAWLAWVPNLMLAELYVRGLPRRRSASGAQGGPITAVPLLKKEPAMAKELVFYTNPQSRGRIVRWMLEEVGQPYRTELLDYATTMKAAPARAINPMG